MFHHTFDCEGVGPGLLLWPEEQLPRFYNVAMLPSDWEASRIHFRARRLSDRVGSAGEDCVKGAHRGAIGLGM